MSVYMAEVQDDASKWPGLEPATCEPSASKWPNLETATSEPSASQVPVCDRVPG